MTEAQITNIIKFLYGIQCPIDGFSFEELVHIVEIMEIMDIDPVLVKKFMHHLCVFLEKKDNLPKFLYLSYDSNIANDLINSLQSRCFKDIDTYEINNMNRYMGKALVTIIRKYIANEHSGAYDLNQYDLITSITYGSHLKTKDCHCIGNNDYSLLSDTTSYNLLYKKHLGETKKIILKFDNYKLIQILVDDEIIPITEPTKLTQMCCIGYNLLATFANHIATIIVERELKKLT